MKILNSRTFALILICLFSLLTNAQEQFTGSWFVLRSESRENEYFETYKADSISKIGLDRFSYSSTNLYSFLDIKKNGRFKIKKEKKYNGKWKFQNDTIILKLKKSQLYGYIEDNHLKLRVFQDTLKYYDVIIATRLPSSNINNSFSFKGKSFLYEPTTYSSFKFHFLNNNNVIFTQSEREAKWSSTGSWSLIKHNDYLFLSIKTRALGEFLFFLLNETNEEINIYDFSKEYTWDKDFIVSKIFKLKIDEKYSQEQNQKLIGKWVLSDYKPLYKLYENFELKSFNLEIDKSNVKIQIETSDDLIYNLSYKYEIGRIPDYFNLKNDKIMEPLSFIYDETNSKLILCYSIDSKARKYAYDLKIELKKL